MILRYSPQLTMVQLNSSLLFRGAKAYSVDLILRILNFSFFPRLLVYGMKSDNSSNHSSREPPGHEVNN